MGSSKPDQVVAYSYVPLTLCNSKRSQKQSFLPNNYVFFKIFHVLSPIYMYHGGLFQAGLVSKLNYEHRYLLDFENSIFGGKLNWSRQHLLTSLNVKVCKLNKSPRPESLHRVSLPSPPGESSSWAAGAILMQIHH